jgi:hypothetical protein
MRLLELQRKLGKNALDNSFTHGMPNQVDQLMTPSQNNLMYQTTRERVMG